MKKIVVFFVFAAVLGGRVEAQDTLYRDTPLSNYHNHYWPDTTGRYTGGVMIHALFAREMGREFYTQDSLKIYGIAAAMIHRLWDDQPCVPPSNPLLKDTAAYLQYYFPQDPTWEHAEESLKLYQFVRGRGMQMLGDSLPVHIIDTPVTYYLQPHFIRGHYGDDSCRISPVPVYERYFSTPQTVYGTFVVAYTLNAYDFADNYMHWCPMRIPVEVLPFGNGDVTVSGRQNQVVSLSYPNGPGIPSWVSWGNLDFFYFMFPILTPKPEDNPVAVDRGEDLERYVSVSPNPAEERAEVVSSLGMTAIEVFTVDGRQVRSIPASGHKATLELADLSSGTYLLHVHTAVGTIVKKLLVR